MGETNTAVSPSTHAHTHGGFVGICFYQTFVVQLAALAGPSGIRDMKKVMMKDHVEDRKPF